LSLHRFLFNSFYRIEIRFLLQFRNEILELRIAKTTAMCKKISVAETAVTVTFV